MVHTRHTLIYSLGKQSRGYIKSQSATEMFAGETSDRPYRRNDELLCVENLTENLSLTSIFGYNVQHIFGFHNLQQKQNNNK